MTLLRLPWRPRQPLTCRDVVELVTAYLEDELDAPRRRRVEAHLAACEHCSAYVEQLRQTLSVLGEIPPGTLTDDAEQELLRAFRGFAAGEDREDG